MQSHQPSVGTGEDLAKAFRRFGHLMAALAALLAVWALAAGRATPLAAGAAVLSLAVLGIAQWRAAWLERPFRLWMGFGGLLGRVVSPIVLAILFFGLITPVALVQRLAGRDELRLRMRRDAASHWQARQPAGPEPGSFDHQF